MPKQSVLKDATPEFFDAGDMADAYALAECDMRWMGTAIASVHAEIKKLQDLVKQGGVLGGSDFYRLITNLEMYEYIADDRRDYHAKQAEEYTKEWKDSSEGIAHD